MNIDSVKINTSLIMMKECIISYSIAWYFIVGFGARAVSHKTPIYFILICHFLSQQTCRHLGKAPYTCSCKSDYWILWLQHFRKTEQKYIGDLARERDWHQAEQQANCLQCRRQSTFIKSWKCGDLEELIEHEKQPLASLQCNAFDKAIRCN